MKFGTLKVFAGVGVIFIVGFFSGRVITQSDMRPTSVRGQSVRQSGFTYINPLLECEIAQEVNFTELAPFRRDIDEIVEQRKARNDATHVSVYFRDLNNGPWIGINEKEEFSPASLLKVPLMMSVFYQAESDPDILEKEVIYNGSFDRVGQQNIDPASELEEGKTYKITELIKRMIQYSDNNAAKLVSMVIDQKAFFKPYENLSLKPPIVQNGEYYIRVKDYATFFRVLFNASYLSQAHSEEALKILTTTEYQKGIVAGVPEGIAVAHKFGERVWTDTNEHQIHDCGIVYYPQHPYLLCVMTKGNSFEKLQNVVSEISKKIYESVDKQLQKTS